MDLTAAVLREKKPLNRFAAAIQRGLCHVSPRFRLEPRDFLK